MNLARVSEYVHALITSPFNNTCLGLTETREGRVPVSKADVLEFLATA